MVKFFKVIVDFLLIVLVAAALALFVPPLFGYAANVVDEQTESNMDLGSVTYSRSKSSEEISAGDDIVRSDVNSFYVYEVNDISKKGTTAEIEKLNSKDTETIKLNKTVQKYLFTIPFIGYIAIALQSTEGMIVLGLAAALLIILMIILEVVGKKKSDDENDKEDEDEDSKYFRELNESKEESSREYSKRLKAEKKAEQKAAKQKKKAGKHGKSAEEAAPEKEGGSASQEPVFAAPDGLTDVTSDAAPDKALDQADQTEGAGQEEQNGEEKTISAEKPVSTDSLPDVQAALEAALSTAPVRQMTTTIPQPQEEEEPAELEIPDEIELAIPIRSLDNYLDEAYSRGDDPHVRKDDVTGIRLVDYSDCL